MCYAYLACRVYQIKKIKQINLFLNYVRFCYCECSNFSNLIGQLTEAETSMSLAGNYLKAFYLNDYHVNTFEDLDDILTKINHTYSNNNTVIKLRLFQHCEGLVSYGLLSEVYNRSTEHSALHRDITLIANNSSKDSANSEYNTANTQYYNQPSSGKHDAMQAHQSFGIEPDSPGAPKSRNNEPHGIQDNAGPIALGLKSSQDTSGGYKAKPHKYTYAEKLLKIAHVLHYCSIAILGLFVVQVNSFLGVSCYHRKTSRLTHIKNYISNENDNII